MTSNEVKDTTEDVEMAEAGASQSDTQMQSTTATESIKSAFGAEDGTPSESVPRKSSQVNNPDEKAVCISGIKPDEVEEVKEETEPEKPLKGLQNQGATCYMNSLLQALYMTPDFRQMIYKFNYDPAINSEKRDCILYQLQKLFVTLQIGKLSYASTTGLTTSFGWDTTQSFEQQDVQEFMRVLFDAIEQSFEQNNIYGVIEDIYMGEGSGFVKCQECGYLSKSPSKFSDLQLPIKNEFEKTPANESVEEALFKYLCPTTLEGDNAYQCSGCDKKVTANKGDRLDRLPKILTLQLQRFTYDRNWQRKKLDERVTFPLTLNMNHFLDETKQSDPEQLRDLINQNPLKDVKPSTFRQSVVKQAQANAKQRAAGKNDMERRFEEQLKTELDSAGAELEGPSVKGQGAESRAAEAKRQREQHRKNMQRMKAAGKKRKGGFDRSKLSANFMANTKAAKDETSGWAFDFSNPDAGASQGMPDSQMMGDDETLARVMEQSRLEAEKADNAAINETEGKNDDAQKKSAEERQQEADEAEKQRKISKKLLIKKIEEQNIELTEKYLQEGPFVYELYAVMIHSGGTYGGHYYAYIKDIEDGKWYNFNDSIVRPISLIDIVETFGPEPVAATGPNKRSNMAARRMAYSRIPSAYMLMYRIVDKTEDRANLNTHEDEIPDEIKADVALGEVQTQQVVVQETKKSQRMQLKIVFRPREPVVVDTDDKKQQATDPDADLTQYVFWVNREEDTYATFFDMVYKEVVGDDNTEKQRENFRLRMFNPQHKFMTDSYTDRDNETLNQLKIYPMRTLALEEKLPDEVFEEYDPDSMMIKICFWRPGIQALNNEVLRPYEIKIKRNMPVTELIALIIAENKKMNPDTEEWKLEDVCVLKRNPLLNTSHLEIISDKTDKLFSQLRILDGTILYIENKNVPHPQGLNAISNSDADALIGSFTASGSSTPKWEIEHELDGLRFQIKFNEPLEEGAKLTIPESAITAQQIFDCQYDIYKQYVIVDRRISVLDLKLKISEAVGIGLDQLVIRRGGSHGVELLEDDDSLKQAQFFNHYCLFLQRGQPSVLGQRKISFLLAKSSQAMLKDIMNSDDGPVQIPDNSFFSFEELAQIPCKTSSKISVIKSQLVAHLAPIFPHLNLTALAPSQIRLREKIGEDKLTSVLQDQRELSRYQIFDGKEIAIQILPEAPSMTLDELDQSYLVMVKAWNPSDWTMTDLVEVNVPKNATLNDFANVLNSKFSYIVPEMMECVKINSSWNFSRVQLPYEQWVSLSGNECFMQSGPFYVQTDGTFFVVRDKSIDGREMTEEERAIYKSSDYESQMFAAPVIRTRTGPDGKIITYSGPVEKGIKITVKQKGESASSQPDAAAAATGSSEDAIMNSGEEQKTE